MNDASNETKKSSYVKWFFIMDVIINNEKKIH